MASDVDHMDEAQHDTEIVLEVTSTVEDQLRYNEFLLRQPALRRRRAIRLVLSFTVYPILGILIGFLAGAAASGRAPTFQLARALVRQDPWGNLVLPWGLLAGFYAVLWIAWWVTLRPRMRRLIRRQLRERPGVDPADPQFAERVRCSFGPRGYRVETPSYTHEVTWQGVEALDETADLLCVRTGLAKGYVLPKRDIPADRLIAIRLLADKYLSAAAA